MGTKITDPQPGSVSALAPETEPAALPDNAFPTVEAHAPSQHRWKAALAVLAAGGLLTACNNDALGGGGTPGTGPTTNYEKYKGPFTAKEAAHLLRRAAAVGTSDDADHLARLGLEKAVDYLLEEPDLPTEEDPSYFRHDNGRDWRERYVNEWANHWLSSNTPAAERLTFFWHGHFATEAVKGKYYMTYLKINKIRELSLGTFRDLLYMIAEDPSMIIYLDSSSNVKGHPNENWGRELMELFTLGLDQYTEKDIQEVSRAFTGWTVLYERYDDEYIYYFTFDGRKHDFGPKQLLGHTVFNRYAPVSEGYDVLDIILGMDQTYKYITSKLLRYYYRPNPEQEMIEQGADVLKGGTVRDFLKWLFTHPNFYAEETRNSLIKSPFEYVLGLFYASGNRQLPDEKDLLTQLRNHLDHDPYNPPNVAGWPLANTGWLSDATLLQRIKLIDFATEPEKSNADYRVFMDVMDYSDRAPSKADLVAPEAHLL